MHKACKKEGLAFPFSMLKSSMLVEKVGRGKER